MNSEKVKEIKKGLKFMMGFVLSNKLPYIDGNTPKQIAYEEIFNYINELESENERLLEQRNKTYSIWVKDTKQLKDRIAELKVDLKNSIDMQKEMLDGFKTATKEAEENLAREIPNLLKQFAERLKEKAEYDYLADYNTNDEPFIEKPDFLRIVNETLKEFINEKLL
jgi:hypothetical protein